MNSVHVIYLGGILSALGSLMVIFGTTQLTKDIEQKNNAQLTRSVEDIKGHFKAMSNEQKEQITGTLVGEQRISVTIQDLTLPEKWVLIRFVPGYQVLTKEVRGKMHDDLHDYFKNLPSRIKEDPFDILNRKNLVISKKVNSGSEEHELTPFGLEVVTFMVRNKIAPFDIVKGY